MHGILGSKRNLKSFARMILQVKLRRSAVHGAMCPHPLPILRSLVSLSLHGSSVHAFLRMIMTISNGRAEP